MSKCPNCGTTITCGCQKRTLPNGSQGCSNCVNRAVKTDKTPVNPFKTNTTNKFSSLSNWGKDRYKNV